MTLVQYYLQSYKISIILSLGLCLFTNGLSAQEFEFASLQGTPINTDGWNMQGAAKIGSTPGSADNGEVILTDPINTTSGAIFYNTPINLAQCKKWVAEFDFRIFDGSVADGLAFCYLDVPPAGFISGGGIGIPATANGLKIVLDTYRNCGTESVPKLQIRYGVGYEECNGQPTRSNNDGTMGFIRSPTYNKCRIEYEEGNIRVLLNGVEYLTAFQTFTFTGYFGFTSSTGGFNDRHSIKNVRIFTEMPPSTAGQNSSLVFCPGGTVQLGAAATADKVYKWTPETGLSNPAIANPTVQLNNATANPVSVNYIVETAFSDRPGCTSRDSVTVTVLANPRPAFTHDTVCITGGTIQFTNTTTQNGTALLNGAFQWNFGDVGAAINTSTLQNPEHVYSTQGTYEVSLRATSADGCIGDTSIVISPFVAPPVIDFSVTGDSCSGYLLSFNPAVNQAGNVATTSLWNFGDGNTSMLTTPTHQFVGSGVYQVAFEVKNPYCPAQSITKPIVIRQSPLLALQNADTVFCLSDNAVPLNRVAVTNALAGSGSYIGDAIAGGLFLPQAAGVGIHTIQYQFTGNNGCNNELAFNLEVLDLPDFSAGPDKISIEATPVILNGEAGTNVANFNWGPDPFINDVQSITPTVNPPTDRWYILEATGINGCLASDSVRVTVLPSLFIPNAFSPNGDGINDEWIIRNLNDYQGCEIRIFDRYGKIVFNSVGYNKPWNGKSVNGVPVPAGVYYFIIDPKNGTTIRQGSVTILR